jgi:hypothetical protein
MCPRTAAAFMFPLAIPLTRRACVPVRALHVHVCDLQQSRKAVKLVAVGDSGVGKTKMLYAWSWPASQNNFSGN